MTIYTDLQSLAGVLLQDFKQGTVKLIKITVGTGPADNPGSNTETTYTLDATVRGVSDKVIARSFAFASDLEVCAAVIDGVTPDEEDFIEIDSVRYKIVQDISPPAAGTKVVWKFIVRKGG